MMFVRTLVIWLLMLAIPAQGMAAATMAFCGSAHHGSASAGADAGLAPEHPHHGHAVPAVELNSGAFDVAGSGTAIEQPGPAAQQTCSACASCCSLGAILTTVSVLPTASPEPTVFSMALPLFDAFAADGPDRPPRDVLA